MGGPGRSKQLSTAHTICSAKLLAPQASGSNVGSTGLAERLCIAAEELGELLEFVEVEIGDGPECHSLARPVDDVKALAGGHFWMGIRLAGGKDKEIYRM